MGCDTAIVDQPGMTLRDEIYKHQHVGPLGEAHAALYRARNYLLGELQPYDHDRQLPLVTLSASPDKWRGRYESLGAFGMTDVITINVHQFDTALDACETLAHELAHWAAYPVRGHALEWERELSKFGIVWDGEHNYSSKWWDMLYGPLSNIGLEAIRLRTP